jgi:hypothetical protein
MITQLAWTVGFVIPLYGPTASCRSLLNMSSHLDLAVEDFHERRNEQVTHHVVEDWVCEMTNESGGYQM